MNIGEAAAKARIPVKNIRYYEEIGLVQPPRDCNGYRRFRDTDVDKLAHLGRARALGFSIEDCRCLVDAIDGCGRRDPRAAQLARQLMEKLDQKMQELRDQRSELLKLIECCDVE